ncbi:DUF6215 domain-containing protein [Streptomyces sp. cmx-4-9]|uniref:DUF6215 domain-containing protein n=1 Tax=Streptomyces sp. cmx-4-9 TaxID=2790941 RepID=UPI0039816787
MGGNAAGTIGSLSSAGQAVAAVVLIGGGGLGLWAADEFGGGQGTDPGPAACEVTEDELPPEYASGAQLCAALNRPDLPELLGTPQDTALSAGGRGTWLTLLGDRTAAPEAKVSLETYAVQLTASYGGLPVARTAEAPAAAAQPTTVLGHPAVLASERTIAISLNGGKTGSGPGGIARRLVVAKDVKDGGDSFEVVIWRHDGRLPDDAALYRVAEQVLPAVPGWTAG